MMEEIIKIINNAIIIIGFASIFYWIPFLIRKGWGDAKNRTSKVCDICFRDIARWNKKNENKIEDINEKIEKLT